MSDKIKKAVSEGNLELFERQKKMLEQFAKCGAISKEYCEKEIQILIEKMNIEGSMEQKNYEYRIMTIDEAERINEIDATWYIKNVWRNMDGKLTLVEIDWTEYELPNGLTWHLEHFRSTVRNGGAAIGCFDKGTLVGYGTLNREVFGNESKYVLLDQLFVSKDYRNKGIGKKIVNMMNDKASYFGADKIYICAASAEDTIVFYKGLGFTDAVEINTKLLEQDVNDIPMERIVK